MSITAARLDPEELRDVGRGWRGEESTTFDPPMHASLSMLNYVCSRANRHGLRRRKNCALFVAGRVTDFLMPSSVTLALLATQLAGAASVPA